MATTKKSTGGSKTPSGNSASKKAKTVKKGKKAAGGAQELDVPVDPRAPVELTTKTLAATVTEIEAIMATLTPPAEPVVGDLVDALIHFVFTAGIPCGIGQEVLRRIALEFVDRNEFRITEAFEVELLFGDLAVPDLFDRCRTIQQAVNQVYGDQNKVSLEHLREAALSERKSFFQRIPAITTDVSRFLGDILSWEEISFSPRSTQRVQQRVGVDPDNAEQAATIDRLRLVLAPFGHLPLTVGPGRSDGKPTLQPVLSPACLLARLAPNVKK